MKILLDTHIFLWYISADLRLPAEVRDAVRDPENEVFLSVASVWEAVIKYALRRLDLPESPAENLPRQRVAHGVTSLQVEEPALPFLAGLPNLHRDPFDRIMIVQAQQHGLHLATVDEAVRAYPIPLLPAR